jgi:hypothetical protein
MYLTERYILLLRHHTQGQCDPPYSHGTIGEQSRSVKACGHNNSDGRGAVLDMASDLLEHQMLTGNTCKT